MEEYDHARRLALIHVHLDGGAPLAGRQTEKLGTPVCLGHADVPSCRSDRVTQFSLVTNSAQGILMRLLHIDSSILGDHLVMRSLKLSTKPFWVGLPGAM